MNTMNNAKNKGPHESLNPGDKVSPQEDAQEKVLAVDAPDITGDHIEVPTYFDVEGEDGNTEKLHHIKDADEISDVVRQARTDENGDRKWW